MSPTVALVGSGPAAEATMAALGDANADVVQTDVERIAAADLAVVADAVGATAFERATEVARESGTPWLAVELGGVGGYAVPEVDAAVSGFAPPTACFDCLRTRVAANAEEGTDSPDIDQANARFAGALAGREAATLVSGGESSVLGGVLELPHAERNVLPVPGCSCATGTHRDPTLDRGYTDVAIDDALARAEETVDDRVGVVSSIGEVESFPAPYYLAQVADTTGFSDVQAAEQAAGVAADWNAALMKALGEALERYSAGVYRDDDFESGRPADFQSGGPADFDSVVAPDRFVRPEDWPEPDPTESIRWVEGSDLHTDERTLLPAEFVQFPPPETRYKPSITTGLGLGNSSVEALLSGLYETIERDATMLSWYSSFDPLGLRVESDAFETLEKRARAEELSVTPLLVTQDVDVPVVAVAVHRENSWPQFAVGSDADLDPDAAATSALAEALQNWMELRSMGREDAADADGAIGEYADFPETAREFVAVETEIPSASVGADDASGEAELDAVLDRVADADLDVYAARLTPRDVEAVGFEAVRVLAPEAQPLFTGDSFFGERARTVPGELGFEFRPEREPHPYP
ncbi:YcaO-like family protein [Halorussus halophilus]|uniref:YcaO-like family protein n=1 Tax=Halorussus halophilus TaxID=2650975 RepID=UPI001301186B|nr:YcaO-like family protein [Halorussus halophilus]